MLIAQVAGLFATGWIVWSVAVLPRLSYQPLAQIVRSAFLHTLFACGAAVTITLLLYFAISRTIRHDTVLVALLVCAGSDPAHRLIASGNRGRGGVGGECVAAAL